MTPYKNFLIQRKMPKDENETRHLKWKANYYVILDELFKRGLTTPLLKCLNNQQTGYVLRELDEGICSHSNLRQWSVQTTRARWKSDSKNMERYSSKVTLQLT
ncbi:hypothetical protein JHK85_010115 [Glycine max]|uniref:Uncharacterized protein n=1 Tax=Glycine max TaxID=3847 RepID=A0A0R0KIN1_SOYBN|nr:hypothetical protein JHK87_009717 [Glycine soja]KAG5049012.1 hypothetical protein JHK85_010115 [Glycine max]KAH1111072.1 hypothetical protein GYH30_009725 [Glycine max]